MSSFIHRRSWLIATGVGVVWWVVITVVTTLLKLTPATTDEIWLTIIIVGPLIYLVLGVIYVWQSRKAGAELNVVQAALGGLVTVLSVALFHLLLALTFRLVVSPDDTIAGLRQTHPDIEPGTELLTMAFMIGMGLGISVAVGAPISTVSAAIYAWVASRRKTTPHIA